MSECGASLAELKQAQNVSENVRYRGNLMVQRCDCRNSNGLDPVCKCTSPKTPKTKVTRSEASVKAHPPQPRRIFTKPQPPPCPTFKATGPKLGINLNGDTIPIPARYKYRKQFPAVPDPNSQLHWMVRPETPPRPDRRQRNYQKYEEPPNHYRTNTMSPTTNETPVEHNPADSVHQQEQLQDANTNNFHGPETKAESYRAEPSVPSPNPTQEANCMNNTQIEHACYQNKQEPQIQVSQPVCHQAQENHTVQPQAPISNPPEAPSARPVQESQPVQHQAPISNPSEAPVTRPVQDCQPVQTQSQQPVAPPSNHEHAPAPQCTPDPLQPSHPYHEEMPTSASVSACVPKPHYAPQSESAPMPVHRPPTPAPAEDVFGKQLQAATARVGVEVPCPAVTTPVSQPQAMRRDLPPCPDRFYPCSHC